MFNKLMKKENLSIWLAPAIVVLLTIILLILNVYVGLIGVVASLIVVYNAYEAYTKKDQAFKEYADNIELYFDGFSKKAIFSMPFSIVVLDKRNELQWYNSKFKNMVSSKESLVEENIEDLLPGLAENFHEDADEEVFSYSYMQRDYQVHTSVLEIDEIRLIYFIDQTETVDVYNKYRSEQMAIMNIRVDNIEELNSSLTSERRPIVQAEIDSIITTYYHHYGSFIKKTETGRYVAVSHYSALEEMINDKFAFIEEVRGVESESKISPTLSIGIGTGEDSPRENERSANAALDIALGRGGDQVVLKNKDHTEYFGGKNQATQKRTKVKARVVAHALGQLIEEASEVFISGHINPDMDSLGSSIGIWHASMQKGKDAYIVLSEVTPAIRNLYDYAVENIEGLSDHIISPEEAYEQAKASSLYIVTDNHRKTSTEAPDMFDITDSVVIIDHHRRGSDYIDNATLTYLEPSSSSAGELVTEMLVYMDESITISKPVAEALLAGITMDTKNFTQQTGSRTFEAATILKQSGADTDIVNKLFREDFDIIKAKSEIISQAQVYKDQFIIGTYEEESDYSSLIASQAANDLKDANGIEASFVITKQGGRVHISARSNENISVQLIMEKLGGGGHRNMAATQLDTDIDEAIDLLKKAIKEYIEEDNK